MVLPVLASVLNQTWPALAGIGLLTNMEAWLPAYVVPASNADRSIVSRSPTKDAQQGAVCDKLWIGTMYT